MSEHLAAFARASQDRADRLPALPALLDKCELCAPPTPLRRSRFDLIAEVKFRAPSVSAPLGSAGVDAAVERAQAYVRGGAAAISVLTEPRWFGGDLSYLQAVASAVTVPVMRKDFLVDLRQVAEARVFGASGVLLVVRLLDELQPFVDLANRLGMFVLLEAFDAADAARIAQVQPGTGQVLAGLNCRDLDTLQVQPERLLTQAASLPRHLPLVAESGLSTASQVREVRQAGYAMALVGSALMAAPDPTLAVRELCAAGRREAA